MSSKFMLPKEIIDNATKDPFKDKKTSEIDDRRFSPTIKNEAQYYNAIVRFLPPMSAVSDPSVPVFIEKYSHGFQENGQWYIENCPTSLGKGHPCPVCESNRNAYATKDQALIERAKNRRRKKVYIANVLVIKDKQNPQNEGKVMYWAFPKTIFDLIKLKWKPESEYEEPSQPFCPITGYALNLVMKYDAEIKFPSYKGSQFMAPKALGSDEEIQSVLSKTYDLNEFIAPTEFKTFDELNDRFTKVTLPNIVQSSLGSNLVIAPSTTTVSSDTGKTPKDRTPTVAIPAPKVNEEDDTDSWLND